MPGYNALTIRELTFNIWTTSFTSDHSDRFESGSIFIDSGRPVALSPGKNNSIAK